MGIFVTIFLIGLILAIIMLALNFIGGLDMLGGDIDLDMDMDSDIDLDLDTDFDLDTDLDMDSDLDFDTDVDGTTHNVGISYVSPFIISFLLMGIGLGGTVLEDSYSVEAPLLHVGAILFGLLFMVAMRKMFRMFFVETQFNSTVRNRDLVGAIGSVTLRIPKGDIGEVVVPTRLGRLKMAARADDYIPEGTKVKVMEKIGTTLQVRALGKATIDEKKKAISDETKEKEPLTSSESKEIPTQERMEESREGGKGASKEDEEEKGDREESSFTFEAYRKKEEARKPTVIYDQRKITIKDSVISRTDFSEIGGSEEDKDGPTPGTLKDSMKKELKKELYEEEEEEKEGEEEN